jgi:histidinol-phosphate aminotransferase
MSAPAARIRRSVAALHPYTPGEQPSGDGVLKLNTNENPYPPAPGVEEALRGFDPARARLYPDPTCTALRRAAAERHGVAPEQILFGNGSDEVLALCVRAFVEDGAAVGFFDPSYSLYPVLAATADRRVVPTPLEADFAWRTPRVEGVSLFLLTNPNAPTSLGFDLAAIRAFAEGFSGVVVIDEAYADFAGRNGLALARELPNVIVTRTFSKSYSLAHFRLGYAVGPPELIGALHKIRDSYNVNGLTQAVGLAAFTDRAHLEATVARVLATRARVTDQLRARGWTVPDSETNFLFALPPRRPAPEVFAELRARRIFVRHFPGPLTGGHLRITVGTDAEMDRLLAALDALQA